MTSVVGGTGRRSRPAVSGFSGSGSPVGRPAATAIVQPPPARAPAFGLALGFGFALAFTWAVAGAVELTAGCGALLTAWPPNWLRSAARTRSAKSPLPRERKRSYSDAVITGVGTPWAGARSVVRGPTR